MAIPLLAASRLGARDRRGLGVVNRFLSFRVGAMLVRNTIVSSFTFILGLGVLWLLVDRAKMNPVVAAGISFVIANSLHYALGRSWIFRDSPRGLRAGYALFLVNAGIGLGLTMGLYAAMLHFTDSGYLFARVIVSVVAGLVVFLLNAVLNFQQV